MRVLKWCSACILSMGAASALAEDSGSNVNDQEENMRMMASNLAAGPNGITMSMEGSTVARTNADGSLTAELGLRHMKFLKARVDADGKIIVGHDVDLHPAKPALEEQ